MKEYLNNLEKEISKISKASKNFDKLEKIHIDLLEELNSLNTPKCNNNKKCIAHQKAISKKITEICKLKLELIDNYL